MANETRSTLDLMNIEYEEKKFLNFSLSVSNNKEDIIAGSFLTIDITPSPFAADGDEIWETCFSLSVAKAKQLREWLSFAIASLDFDHQNPDCDQNLPSGPHGSSASKGPKARSR
jgi:hypothetical protein